MTTPNGGLTNTPTSTPTTTPTNTQEGQQTATPTSTSIPNPSTPNPSSDVIARLNAQIETLTKENATLGMQYRTIALESLPADKRKEAEALLAEIDKKADLDDRANQLEERARDIRARELVLENHNYGVTAEQLLTAKSMPEMELMAARLKIEHIEKNGVVPQQGGNTNTTTPNSPTPNPANPATLNSDRGGGTSGGSASLPIEGKGRDAVAAHIGNIMRTRHGA